MVKRCEISPMLSKGLLLVFRLSASNNVKYEMVLHNIAVMRSVYYLKDEGLFDYAITACTPEGFLTPTLQGSDFHMAK